MSSNVNVELSVRLLSGDLKSVMVNMRHSVANFATMFAQQHGYNPSATSRMVFMILSEEEEEEVFWSPEKLQVGITFEDVLKENRPLLNLVIRPMDEKNKTEKLQLIRKILKEKSLNDHYDDDTLFSMLSTWHLTYQPPAKGNRYITMKHFVEQNGEAFWPMTEEELRQALERKQVREFRNFVKVQAEILIFSHYYYNHTEKRNQLLDQLEQIIASGQVETILELPRGYFTNYIMYYEMAKMGVPSRILYAHSENHRPSDRYWLQDMEKWIERAGPITMPSQERLPAGVRPYVWRI